MSVEFEENNSFKNLYAQGNHSNSGMVSYLIKKGFAKSEKGANQILVTISIIFILISIYIFMVYVFR
jgi:hypothetical protein